jgi:hypothetical protein
LAEDFRPLVREALQRGEKRIVIPPGVYQIRKTLSSGQRNAPTSATKITRSRTSARSWGRRFKSRSSPCSKNSTRQIK